ncbi:ferritin-like domain-containing protein [Curvibacter sp. CHRR-16]|uniref:ferritin-like domain-containing protein n=1 Tax=Curvibacter sp. CHRR-16 TaxID=2835872 RepID=UPI001BD97172|nr:ferritin-like domain-containing protein [Curvibacter sp. CHRR-16]MBT0568795.1 ferritin-like domain-containing protein [Curvibacter sp. CHRR-16]
MDLRNLALQAFSLSDPQAKVEAVLALFKQRHETRLDTHVALHLQYDDAQPGNPPQLQLVAPQDVPRRSPYTRDGLAALAHSIAHIEYNAIALALDAVWRFADMPTSYYQDWLQVAYEEAQHFSLLQERLRHMGYAYGDFAAHQGLWDVCSATRHHITARMALVPRTLEARGLDATPVIQDKLRRVGSPDALALLPVLDTILREEIGHVATGNRWFYWLCEREQREPHAFYAYAAQHYRAPKPKPPFNLQARAQAGFSATELEQLLLQNQHEQRPTPAN